MQMFIRKTKKIRSEFESISSLEEVILGNYKQTILVRGENAENPIMLFLHGGPGSAQIGFAPKFQRKLEKDFIVVNWDQRGAGLSYSKDLTLETLSMEQIIQDAIELIKYLLNRFNQPKLYLVGHSWGSVIGVQVAKQIPELIKSYIGIGQVVNMKKGEQISYEYTLEQASVRKVSQAVRELHRLVYDPASFHELDIQRKWLAKFEGFYVGISMKDILLPNILFAKEYTLLDWFRYVKSAKISLEKMWRPLLEIDFTKTDTKLDVPVYFFVGAHDFLTPYELTEEYYHLVECPYKELVWFENSAHLSCFEESEKFYQECLRIKEMKMLGEDIKYDKKNSYI
jgi:pimeloyl-ACP methyl ester carboxylesterase